MWVQDFHRDKPIHLRQSEANQILAKHVDRVPVIVDRASSSAPEIDRHKFLCPIQITVGQFAFIIRRRINLQAEKALFIFCGDVEKSVIPPTSTLMGEVYKPHRSDDNFLYITYALENTFGGT